MSVTADDLVSDPVGHFPTATVACFDPTTGELPRRQLAPDRTMAFLERLAAAGVPGLLIAASTGHGHLRTVDELQQWLRCAAQAPIGSAVRMALLRPEDGLQANRRLLELLAELDYTTVFFRPGTDLAAGASQAAVYDQLRPLVELAAEMQLAIGLYSISDVSGVPLQAETVARLLNESPAGPRIVACKVTEADYATSTLQFLEHPQLQRLKIVQGWDPHLSRALQDGKRYSQDGRPRCGVTSGPMNCCLFQYLHLLQAAERQDWQETAAAQRAVSALFSAMQDDPQRFADLQRAKYIMGLGHPLTGAVTREQAELVLQALAALERNDDRCRLARSLDLMQDGPFHERLQALADHRS